MHALPPLELRGTTVRLPLSQGAAVVLFDALLSADVGSREKRIEEILLDDAPFALWTICRATEKEQHELTSPCRLAEWLAPRLAEELAAIEVGAKHVNASREKQLVSLAGAAARVAERSAALAKKVRGLDPNEARFAGLLHAADAWLMAAGAKREATAREALPQWLRSLLADVRATGPPDKVEKALAALVRSACGERVARNESSWRVANHDEASRLKTLADRLARLERLENRFAETLETEKLEALAELAAGAAHEFNPPLAVISGRAQLYLREEQDAERRRELALINRQALRVHEMVADLMHFARPARPRPSECDLVALVREALAGLEPWADERRVAIEFSSNVDSLPVQLDPVQMQVAVRAVVTNAVEALGSGGCVRVECATRDADTNVEIVVHDSGPGITPDVRRHLFDPFYSGRAAGRGLGLGLSKCWRIVTNHGGRVEVESVPSKGTTVRLVLPKVAAAFTDAAAAE